MILNFLCGLGIRKSTGNQSKLLLYLGVAGNLLALAYYKYANFFVEQLALGFDISFHLTQIILPLAISFFTFQQIAYLVDVHRKEAHEYSFLHYCLFVSFFPQLIAGPIVHHKQMMPQFLKKHTFVFNSELFSLGIMTFTLGLGKKLLIADNMAVYATPVFSAVEQGLVLNTFELWGGAIAYSLQLYFDFSGYSDMAIGIALMFGIKLPMNFNSPYQASSIIDFWRRWHITLSTFLRDYLYFALGGNRKGNIRRFINLFLTMLLGGLWHGAGWTFLIWGMLHGTYLIINHTWRKLRFSPFLEQCKVTYYERILARILTLLAVLVSWVYFRSESVTGANSMLASMFSLTDIQLPLEWKYWLSDINIFQNAIYSEENTQIDGGILSILGALVLALCLPNSQSITQFIKGKLSVENQTIAFLYKPRILGACFGVLLAACLLSLSQVSEFLYFQF